MEESLLDFGSQLFPPEVLFQIEFNIAPEPKALSVADLKNLAQKYGSLNALAEALGVSEAFVRHSVKEKKYFKRRRNES